MRKVYQVLASSLMAHRNCILHNNVEWRDIWERRIEWLEKEYLPSGSGFDAGTTVDIDACGDTKMVFKTAYHHMDENGFYDGWTSHEVIAEPEFLSGIDVKVTGLDENDIREYIGDTFFYALTTGFGGWPDDI